MVPIVVDTNILVPSLFRSTHLLGFILAEQLVLVTNDFLYEEALRITNRMWDNWYKLKMTEPLSKIHELLDLVFGLGYTVPEMPDNWPPASRDRDDDPFLWVASQGRAEYIISHDDRHMLELGDFKGIPIGKPKQFFEWVQVAHPITGA